MTSPTATTTTEEQETHRSQTAATEASWKNGDRFLRLEQIQPSAFQPRKHFSPAAIAELVQSFKEHGFDPGISRLLVRPLNEVRIDHEILSPHWYLKERSRKAEVESRKSDGDPPSPGLRRDSPDDVGEEEWQTIEVAYDEDQAKLLAERLEQFEIVLGESRWRAATDLHLEKAPVAVREMSDLEVLKKQMVENLSRKDLTALEEAGGYKRMEEMGMSRQEIADSVGKGIEHVAKSLLLCRIAGTPIAEALEKELIYPAHAREISRVPSKTMQLELLQKVLSPPDGSEPPWNRNVLQEHIFLNYQRDLREATFDKTDVDLVQPQYEEGHEGEQEHRLWGGACLDCPMNKMPEGASNRRGQTGFCTHLECFQMKTIEAFNRWSIEQVESRKAKGENIRVLSHAENAALWGESGTELAHDSDYIELDQPPSRSELRSDVDVVDDWKVLVKGQNIEMVLGRDTAGKVHELALHDQAKKAAHLNGHMIFRDSEQQSRLDHELSSTKDRPARKTDEQVAGEALKQKENQQRDVASNDAEIAAIVAASGKCVRRGMLQLPKQFWSVMASSLLDAIESAGELDELAARQSFELDAESIKRMSLGELLGLVVDCSLQLSDGREVWAKLFNVDLKKARKAQTLREEKIQRPTPNAQRRNQKK